MAVVIALSVVALIILASMYFYPDKPADARTKQAKPQGDEVVKADDDSDFRKAVDEAVDKRLKAIEAADKKAVEATAEREAARKARRMFPFSGVWHCTKCGSDDFALKYVKHETSVGVDPNFEYLLDSFGSGPNFIYETFPADVLNATCDRCGFYEQLNPLDAT